jgi:ribose 5-phosphate isomerase B
MKVGIATDHGGFGLKEELAAQLRRAGHEVVDFGAHKLESDDDYPTLSLRWRRPWPPPGDARYCHLRQRRGGFRLREQSSRRPCLPDSRPLFARQGVEDDHMNILCMGGRTVGPAVAWDLAQTFLGREYSQAEATPSPARQSGRAGESEKSEKANTMKDESTIQLGDQHESARSPLMPCSRPSPASGHAHGAGALDSTRSGTE